MNQLSNEEIAAANEGLASTISGLILVSSQGIDAGLDMPRQAGLLYLIRSADSMQAIEELPDTVGYKQVGTSSAKTFNCDELKVRPAAEAIRAGRVPRGLPIDSGCGLLIEACNRDGNRSGRKRLIAPLTRDVQITFVPKPASS